MEQLLMTLFASPEFQAMSVALIVHLGASVINAITPNEADDAPWWKRMFGKTIRALSLSVGKAVPKKFE